MIVIFFAPSLVTCNQLDAAAFAYGRVHPGMTFFNGFPLKMSKLFTGKLETHVHVFVVLEQLQFSKDQVGGPTGEANCGG
jgi:hypothetical protein